MKKYSVLILTILIGSLGLVNAQKARPQQKMDGNRVHQMPAPEGQRPANGDATYSPETKAMMRADRLAKTLDLTDDVKAKVAEQFLKEEKVKAQREQEMKAQQSQDREKMKAEREQNDAALEKIIGAEKMQMLKAEREKRRAEMRQNRPLGPRPEKSQDEK